VNSRNRAKSGNAGWRIECLHVAKSLGTGSRKLEDELVRSGGDKMKTDVWGVTMSKTHPQGKAKPAEASGGGSRAFFPPLLLLGLLLTVGWLSEELDEVCWVSGGGCCVGLERLAASLGED